MAQVLIVGAGIVGLSAARAAIKAGHAATVLEQGAIPNVNGASYDRHRMIRPHYGRAAGYTLMVAEAFEAWERLWQDLGRRHYAEVGAVAVSLEPGDYGEQTWHCFKRLGIPHQRLDRAGLEAVLPHLRLPAEAWGVVAGPAGPLFADRIVEDLVAWLRERGAVLRENARVAALDSEAGAVLLEGGETLAGDHLVVAAGAWLPDLDPRRYGELPTYRQALLYVAPPARYEASWRSAPAIVAIGDHVGYTLPDQEGAGLKFGHGAHRRPARPEQGFATDPAEAAAILAPFGPYLKDAEAYRPLRLKAGYYVMDASRKFRVEAQGRAMVVTNCDGQMFKFGPLLGERLIAAFEGRLAGDELSRWAAGELDRQA